tara:strand:- start:11547 stop:12923 length:1377 start_codon:yes stop_codon:yes gene_type:complete
MNEAVTIEAWISVFDNDALVPEFWANEALMVLESNMVASRLVDRQYEPTIAEYGDTVNAHRPGSFVAKRKTDDDNVTTQAANSTKVPVVLDQWLHVSFIIKDGELSKGFVNLLDYHLRPALIAHAEGLDQVVLSQGYRFLGNSVGKLEVDPGKGTVIAAREKMTNNKCPLSNRIMFISPDTEGSLLDIGEFTKANEAGDDGEAIREANLGRKLGFNFFTGQNTMSVAPGSTTVTGAIDNGAGYALGSTVLTVDGLAAAIANGSWCTIGGDMTPQQITATVGAGTPTQLTVTPGLATPVADDAVITVYTAGAIDEAANYAAGWVKPITVDGFTVAPKVGQLVSFGTDSDRYGSVFESSTTEINVDRALKLQALNDKVVGLGPAGNYNFAMHPNAVSLVSRPLAQPVEGAGARSAVVEYGGVALRVVITYDGEAQGHRVTVDHLAGIEVMDQNLGCVMLG